MGSTEFLEFARKTVLAYACGRIDPTDTRCLYMDDVFVVWYCKTLQNHKALLSTTLYDGMYYEVTFNGDKNEAYLDAYKKWENVVVKRGNS